MTKSYKEAFWWSLFSAGGMIAAMLVPVQIFLTGIAEPMRWVTPEHMRALVSNPLTKLYLLALLSLPFFHCAHRIRHVLYDVGFSGMQTPVAVVCYGAALLCTLYAVVTVVSL
jgi:fumarate reductase subunit D